MRAQQGHHREAGFVGWWRPGKGHRWERIADGKGYSEALTRTLDTLRELGHRRGESVILEAHRVPWENRR